MVKKVIKLIACILSLIVASMVAYACGAFYSVSFDISVWSYDTRAAILFTAASLFFVLCGLSGILEK